MQAHYILGCIYALPYFCFQFFMLTVQYLLFCYDALEHLEIICKDNWVYFWVKFANKRNSSNCKVLLHLPVCKEKFIHCCVIVHCKYINLSNISFAYRGETVVWMGSVCLSKMSSQTIESEKLHLALHYGRGTPHSPAHWMLPDNLVIVYCYYTNFTQVLLERFASMCAFWLEYDMFTPDHASFCH